VSRNDKGKVGYCNPPKHTRFVKGQSGNPKGRPKGKPNVATVLQKALNEKVAVSENGHRKTITKLQAAIKQLVNKAASGELRALRYLMELARSAEERSGDSPIDHVQALAEIDQKVLKEIFGQLGPDNDETKGEDN
jgi:uncharacterized protein DUF5681